MNWLLLTFALSSGPPTVTLPVPLPIATAAFPVPFAMLTALVVVPVPMLVAALLLALTDTTPLTATAAVVPELILTPFEPPPIETALVVVPVPMLVAALLLALIDTVPANPTVPAFTVSVLDALPIVVVDVELPSWICTALFALASRDTAPFQNPPPVAANAPAS